ncbi:hypothetical protein [Nostoc sp.]
MVEKAIPSGESATCSLLLHRNMVYQHTEKLVSSETDRLMVVVRSQF